jgi:hypothetical protein
MPIRTYTNWNVRASDEQEQIEPFRKYFFICEGANTETYYFRKLIDNRKQLNIHPMINLCLLEKTDEHRNLSYPKKLLEFAELQKLDPELQFDEEHDKMVIVFDGDIFEGKVPGYDELIESAEANGNIVGITNPGFEVFLLLHLDGVYEEHIKGKETKFFTWDENGRLSHPYNLLHDLTGMNSKKNSKIGDLAENVQIAIAQEKQVNQDIHDVKGKVTSNIASIIENIIKDKPNDL